LVRPEEGDKVKKRVELVNSKQTTSQSTKSRLEDEMFDARKKDKLENRVERNVEFNNAERFERDNGRVKEIHMLDKHG